MEKEDRYISVEQSVINSCREINSMRAGLDDKRNWREALSELKKELSEEKFLISSSSEKISKVMA